MSLPLDKQYVKHHNKINVDAYVKIATLWFQKSNKNIKPNQKHLILTDGDVEFYVTPVVPKLYAFRETEHFNLKTFCFSESICFTSPEMKINDSWSLTIGGVEERYTVKRQGCLKMIDDMHILNAYALPFTDVLWYVPWNVTYLFGIKYFGRIYHDAKLQTRSGNFEYIHNMGPTFKYTTGIGMINRNTPTNKVDYNVTTVSRM